MPNRVPTRFTIALACASLATGCGGEPSNPTPPPPPPSVPASLTIHAGQGQAAVAGSAVAINPAVIVKDGQGAIVAGVRVNFTVTQGGGALGVAGTHTDEHGVATPGQWILGAAAGAQAIRAQLHEGSVPAVTIAATALAVEEVLVTQTVTGSGGTISVNRPDSPLHGAELQFEQGALAGAASVTLTEAPTAALTIPSGMSAVGPALGILSPVARLQAGAGVRLPMTPVAGKVMMIGFADPVSRRVTVLPTLRQESDAIVALVPSLDGSTIPGARLAGVSASTARMDEPKSLLFLLAINEELLDRSFDTGFRPGADDWDFPRMAIADLAFLTRPSDAGAPFAAADDGLVTTAIWYYANRRKQGGPPLNGSTQLFAQQPLSSRYGIRWAALAEGDVPPIAQTGGLLIKEWRDWASDDRGRFQWLQFQGIKALMLTTFERPVPVVLLDTDNPDEFNTESHPMAIAYRTSGNTLYLAWPGSPGSEITVQFSEQGMTPFLLPNKNGTANMVRAIGGIHYVNVIDDAKLAAQWTRVANQTIGDAEGWPVPKLHWEKAELDTASTYLLDELQHWWQCAQCPDKVPTPAQLPATASRVQRFQAVNIGTGGGSPELSAGFSSMSLSAEDTFDEDERINRKGFVVYNPIEADSWVGTAIGWLDWRTVTYRKLELEPSEEEISFSQDTTITLTLTPSEPPPNGSRYRWLLRTADTQDSTETTTPTHTRDLEAGTDGWLVFSALEGEHKRPIARDSIRVSPGEDGPFWRILTISDPTGFAEDIEGSGELFDLMERLLAVPGSGVITYETVGDTQELKIRVRRSTLWTPETCCPLPAFNAGTEWLLPLGFAPAKSHPVGPYFTGWGTSHWSQTSTALDTGTITGQWVPATITYTIKDIGVQTGPAGGFRFTATRTGTTMTGTLAIHLWAEDDDSGELEDDASIYQFPFTAVRMAPSND